MKQVLLIDFGSTYTKVTAVDIEKEEVAYSLVEVDIFTGRHHQIRVQMSHAGMPLLGDGKYGNELSRGITEKLEIRHTALLANRLSVVHPVTKEKMKFEIPYPKEWQL